MTEIFAQALAEERYHVDWVTRYLRLRFFDRDAEFLALVERVNTQGVRITELDVVGRELQVPFAVFTLVFTDRHVLALAERLLAASGDTPLAGHLLRIVTVQVVQRRHGDARELEICFAFDALGADLP